MKPYKRKFRSLGKKRRRFVAVRGAIYLFSGYLRVQRGAYEAKADIPEGVDLKDCNVILEWWE